MPLDFPGSPAINDTWTASNGVTYTWNGTMWTVAGSGSGTAYLPLSGGTMTGGDITLFRAPTQPLHASPRSYVDNAINLAGNYLGTWSVAANSPNISAGGAISNANYVATTVNPATPEVAPVGIPGIAGMTIANGDRIIWAAGPNVWQILRNAGLTLAAADARYVDVTGDTMSGALTLPGNAGSALQAVPLQQVPVASSTVPAMDGTAAVGAGTTWARADHIHPTDTTRYAASNPSGYQTAAQVSTAVAPYANNVGRNLIHNSMFNVAQRGAGPFGTLTAYTLDRWIMGGIGDTFSVVPIVASDAIRAAIGDEDVTNVWTNNWTGTAGAGSYLTLSQPIEGIHRLAGKTVTLSFWAACGVGSVNIGINYLRSYGTGGSPSAMEWNAATGQSVTVSGWARHSITTTIASAAGKTLGTNRNSYISPTVAFSSGATNNVLFGGIGVQSSSLYLWGVQLEIGSVATPLEKPDPQVDLANCQRFYQNGYAQMDATGTAGFGFRFTGNFPVAMRVAPTMALSGTVLTNCTGATIGAAGAGGYLTFASVTANGFTSWASNYTASADL